MDSSPLIAGLELLFRRYNITTVDELAMLLRQDMATESRTTLRAAKTAKPCTKDGRLGSKASPAPTMRARRRRACRLQPWGQQSAFSWTAGAWQHRPPTSWTWWTWTLLSVYWQRLYPPPQSLRCRVRALLPTCSIQMRAMILWNGVCPILWCRSLLLCFGAQTGAGRQRMRVSLRRDSADLYWSGRPRSCPDRK